MTRRMLRMLMVTVLLVWLGIGPAAAMGAGVATAIATAGAVVTTSPARWSMLSQPEFRHVAVDSGVSNFEAIAMDRQGFLWVGQQDGLLRWDGYSYRQYHFDSHDPHSLPGNRVFRVHADAAGRIWAGTLGGGLARYDPANDNFVRVPVGSNDKSSLWIVGISDDGSGGLLVVTGRGVEHLAPDGHHLDRIDSRERGLPGYGLFYAMRARDGRFWIGTRLGLFVESEPGGQFVPVHLPTKDGNAPRMRKLAQASDGKVWAGTIGNGAYVIDPATLAAQPISDGTAEMSSEIINDFLEVHPGTMWVATMNHGIAELDEATLAARSYRHDESLFASVSSDTVNALFPDADGSIWVATDDGVDRTEIGGAVLRAIGSVAKPEGLPNAKVDVAALLADGGLILSVFDRYVYLVDAGATRMTLLPKPAGAGYPDTLTYAFSGQIGNAVYAGTQAGLFHVELPSGRTRRVAIPDDASCRAAISDGNKIWAGCENGLWLVTPTAGGSETVVRAAGAESSIKSSIESMVVERGIVWVGTLERGLFRYNSNAHTVSHMSAAPDKPTGLTNNRIENLLFDSRRRLWVVGGGGQMQLIEAPDKVGASGEQADVPFHRLDNPRPLGVPLEDEHGNIWTSGDDGLTLFDGDTLAPHHLGPGEGVFLTDFYQSGVKTAQGELLFCAKRGMLVVRPALYHETRAVPPVVVTSLSVGGKPAVSSRLNLGGTVAPVEVAPDANSLNVEFAALDYAEPERNHYAYRLEGYDRDWVDTDATHRMATYTNLAPGSYRLLLRGSDHRGSWNDAVLAVPLRVLPAWYQTWWARLAGVLAAMGGVSAFVRLRTRALERRRTELERVVEVRTGELTEKNSQLAHLNELQAERQSELTRFLAVASHDLRQPMHTLNLYLGALANMEMSAAAVPVLANVQRCARIMDDMFLALLDLSRLDAQLVAPNREDFPIDRLLAGTEVEFGAQAKVKGLALRHVPCSAWVNSDPALVSQILGNFTANAVRYTRSGGIVIGCRRKGNKLRLAVYDTGIGIAPDKQKTVFEEFAQLNSGVQDRTKGLGLGLAIVRRLARLLQAPVTLESRPGKGSVFAIDLPLAAAPVALPHAEHEGTLMLGAQFSGKLVAVVDDEEGIVQAMRLLLAQWGAQAVTGCAAAEVIAQLKVVGRSPDILITDDRLRTNENGLEVIAAFRQEYGAALPAVIVTGTSTPERMRIIATKHIPLLNKPVNALKLRTTLARLIRQ